MKLLPHIFRQYDVRGIVDRDVDPHIFRAVGRAYGRELHAARAEAGRAAGTPQVAVGRDNRPSSPALADGLIEGLLDEGVDVLDLEVVPTPVAWWADKTMEVEGALQVTGSHNPPEWNGVKMTRLGRSLYGDGVTALHRRIERDDLLHEAPAPSEGAPPVRGTCVTTPVLDRYVEDLTGRFSLDRPVKVVVDCGNGTGSVVAERLLRAVGAEVVPLYCESDGTFPNHHPDPTVDEYLEDLVALVQEEGADAGIAFDGDADRIGVVDDRGRIVRGDLLLLLFGLDLLERRGPGQLLLFDVKCSQVVPEVYEEAGGRTLMWMTGHSLMKEKMHETGAPLAGELSGHICFGGEEYVAIDDALFDACRLAEILSRAEAPLSQQVDRFPRYVSTPELRLEVDEAAKKGIVADAVEHFSREHEVIDVDGARILYGDGWGLIRSSNTQPAIVARFEARTSERLAEIRSEVEGWLRSKGVDV